MWCCPATGVISLLIFSLRTLDQIRGWPNYRESRQMVVVLTVNCYFWKLFSRRKICQDKNSVNPLNGEQVKIRSAAYLFYEVVRIWRLDRLQPISVRVSNRPTTDSFQLRTVGLKILNLLHLRLKHSSHRMLKPWKSELSKSFCQCLLWWWLL